MKTELLREIKIVNNRKKALKRSSAKYNEWIRIWISQTLLALQNIICARLGGCSIERMFARCVSAAMFPGVNS